MTRRDSPIGRRSPSNTARIRKWSPPPRKCRRRGCWSTAGNRRGRLSAAFSPERERQVSRLAEYIKDGDLTALTSGSYAVALGEQLARRLRLGVGDDFILVSPQGGRLTAAGFYPRIRRLQVAAIFSSGLYQYDSGAGLPAYG